MQHLNHLGLELLKLTILSSEKIEVLVETFVKQAAILKKDISSDAYRDQLRKMIEQEEFLMPFAAKVHTFFSKEELERLVTFYKSDLMKKLNDHSSEIYTPLYEAMSGLAQTL